MLTSPGRRWLRFQPGYAIVGAAIVIPLISFGFAARQSYDAAIQAAEGRVERTARVMEEHALKVFETHRLVIEAVDARLQTTDWSSEAQKRSFFEYLKHTQEELPQIGTITIVAADGHLLANSRAYPAPSNVTYNDRDWFQALSGSTGPFVSKAYFGRQSGLAVFNVADRVSPKPDGGFAGAVAISVDRNYFEQFYRMVETTFDHSVVLVRNDGEVLAAEPVLSGQKLGSTSVLLAAMRDTSNGVYENRSSLDGVDRFFGYRKVGTWPVYVRFGISRYAALAPWRSSLRDYGLVTALMSLCLMATAVLALRQTRRWQTAAAALATEAKERERVETQLRQSQKMEAVGQLTGGIAHDFNNMLSVIIGGLNLVQRRLARGETDIGRYIDAAIEGANRAAQLTQRLLAFSRQQPLNPESLAVNDLVGGMSEMLLRTIGETVRLETVLAGGLWRTKADASQLENAILNLAVNARDAMSGSGRLTIETGNAHLDEAYAREHDVAPGQYVMIAVTDTGTGMAPDVVARAFDPFFTTKGVGKGTGLGLSQAYGFVRQSSGHVKIYSELGHGTTFKIYLPRLFDVGPAMVASNIGKAPDKRVFGRPDEIILVVEDEDRVRAVSVDALRDLGFTVIHASGGRDALALLRAHPDVSLLFTDVVMPGMSGRELADTVAAERPELKVLFATGYTRNAIVHNGALDPGIQLISKPFSLEQLALKVRNVLDA